MTLNLKKPIRIKEVSNININMNTLSPYRFVGITSDGKFVLEDRDGCISRWPEKDLENIPAEPKEPVVHKRYVAWVKGSVHDNIYLSWGYDSKEELSETLLDRKLLKIEELTYTEGEENKHD